MPDEPAKNLVPYLQRADELQKHDPKIAYYCRMHAMEKGLQIPSQQRTKDTNAILLSLMNQLEKDKKVIATSDDDRYYVENFAMNLFAKADRVDRAGKADLNTAKTFYASCLFMEVCSQFGEPSPELKEKLRYAGYKAADIRKAIAEGRRPQAGPPGGDESMELRGLEDAGGSAGAGPSSLPPSGPFPPPSASSMTPPPGWPPAPLPGAPPPGPGAGPSLYPSASHMAPAYPELPPPFPGASSSGSGGGPYSVSTAPPPTGLTQPPGMPPPGSMGMPGMPPPGSMGMPGMPPPGSMGMPGMPPPGQFSGSYQAPVHAGQPVAPPAPAQTAVPQAKTSTVAPDRIVDAQKAAKFAASSLAFDDVPAAVVYLQKALDLLTKP